MNNFFSIPRARNQLATYLAIALAYYLTGRLGLFLAIPPGFASPVWPAAGVALVILARGPYWAMVGIWLGSSVLNFQVGRQAGASWEAATATAILIALGSSLQAGLAAYFARQYPVRGTGPGILRFFGLVGPVSCLISATCGTLVLASFDQIELSMLPGHWVTWWFGDVMGTIALAPIAAMRLHPSKSARTERQILLWIPIVLVMAATIMCFDLVRAWEQERSTLQFQKRTSTLCEAITTRMESSIDVLFAIRNYFETEETVSRKSFADFTRHWVENPEIQALEWIPKVTHEQRVIMEEQAQNDGFTDFRFTEKDAQLKTIEAGDRNYYFPVYYVEPYVGNEAALGFDLASHPVRKEALLRACRKETPTATTGIRLILSDRTDFGFLVYLPIDLHVPRGDDDCNVSGFALGIYRIEDLVNTAVAMLDLDDMILRIDDEANDRPLYFRGSDGNTHSDKQQITASMKEAAHITGTETLEVAGLRWHLRFWLTKARLGANQSWSSWSVLVGGFLFTSLLGVLLLHALNRTTEIERLVTERTSALLDTNRALEGEILDRRKAETELVKARDAAQQAAEAKSMFLANMSHEIRTPLNGVIGMNRMLLESELDDDQRELAGTVDTSARSLLNLINDILDFSKIEAGKLEFENIPFDLEVALEEIIDLLHGEVASKGLKLSYHLDEEVPLQLCGDPGRLRQVLLNLLNNAIKFTRIGGVHISISLLKDSLKYALIQFAVRDTGIGIPCNRMNRLFRSFSQVDGSTTRQFGGTGLGLAISRELVERMGGHIEVKSEPDVGSTFTFVVKLDKHEGKPRSVPLKKCGKLVHPHYDGRVLVVEDNIVNQKVAVRMLEKVSLRADVAANGEEAVKAARAINYDLVFMDCQMPRMDGYEATRQLRQTHGKDQLVIVAMTANAMKGDRERCLASGMNDYISKPVRLEELYQILGKWLSHRTREAAVKS